MGSDTCTGIIIPYPDDSQSLRSIIRQLAQIHDISRLLTLHKLHGDIKSLCNHLVYHSFYFLDLVICWLIIKNIVTLRLLLLHMCIP